MKTAAQSELDTVKEWTALARDHGFHDFVSPESSFSYCEGESRRWTNRNQPGIYFWVAENGDGYVGQSVRPQQRLRQHALVYGDMRQAAFLACSKADLNRREEDLIRALERHIPLRNIKLARSTCRHVPLDDVLTHEEQLAFLSGLHLSKAEWGGQADLARKQAHRYNRFLEMPGSDVAARALQLFIERALPKPELTEVLFWSVSFQPHNKLLRLNVGQQEVFTAHLEKSGAVSVRVLTATRTGFFSWATEYQTRSYVRSITARKLAGWLTGKALLSARELVIRLMRHTAPLNSGSHCPQLVRSRASTNMPQLKR